MSAFLQNPLVGLAIAVILTLAAYQLGDPSQANVALVVAWLILGLPIYQLSIFARLTVVRRVSATVAAMAAIGLVLFVWLWRTPEPPISVTNLRLTQTSPFVVGQPISVLIEIHNSRPNIELSGRSMTTIGIADSTALSPRNRPTHEERVWAAFEAKERREPRMPLSAIVGLMHVQEDGPVLTARDVDALNGPNGIVYVVGQIDYEWGAIDYCAFFLPAESPTASLCVNHNGQSERNLVTR